MMDELELDALLVTRSEKGMLLLEAGDEPLFLSTQAREVYDVTGAGDTVIATLAGALASGQDLASAAALANLAAGLVVRKIGVATRDARRDSRCAAPARAGRARAGRSGRVARDG